MQIISKKQIFHQIRKFVLDFKGQSADSNGSKSGRDSFVKGARLSVLILAKSQAGRKFEVLELASLVSIYIF